MAEENAGWLADYAKNVARGLQALSCAQMARQPGAADLFGEATFVRCGPARLCSAGPGGRRADDDDVCVELGDGEAMISPLRLGGGWRRRFLPIRDDMRPGCATADAAIVHFFAGLMRGGDDRLVALPPPAEWDDTLRYKMEKLARFHVRGAVLLALRCHDDRCDFEVALEVSSSPDGKSVSGTDHGVVERLDDAWRVTRPPS